MNTYAVIYQYDDRSAEREATRPEHRAYLSGLAEGGVVVAFSRYADEATPGALIVVRAATREAVEQVIADDPYVLAGLVPAHDVREWPAQGPWVPA